MKHRFITHKRGGLHWITGTKLVDEFREPSRPQDVNAPPVLDLFDDRGRPLYILTHDGPEYQGRPQSEIDQDERDRVSAEAHAYLRDTDWYVTRQIETGKPIPDEVREKREAARGRVS